MHMLQGNPLCAFVWSSNEILIPNCKHRGFVLYVAFTTTKIEKVSNRKKYQLGFLCVRGFFKDTRSCRGSLGAHQILGGIVVGATWSVGISDGGVVAARWFAGVCRPRRRAHGQANGKGRELGHGGDAGVVPPARSWPLPRGLATSIQVEMETSWMVGEEGTLLWLVVSLHFGIGEGLEVALVKDQCVSGRGCSTAS